ncbi:hypothetical protein Ancab_013111 [Ancistrocladus abbreviatus]
MDQDQATAAKLEALKDVYNDPPKGTVKTIITENGQVVDFVKIEEQPAFDHPLLKDHKIQMKPSSHPIEREPRPNENVVKPTIEFAEQIPEGTIPIFRSRKGNFRKTTGPGMVFLRPSNDQSGGTNTSSVKDANENEAEAS